MSRIGSQPIDIPKDTTVDIDADTVIVRGPKGTLNIPLYRKVTVSLKDGEIIVSPIGKSRIHKAMHGTVRSLIANAIIGVTRGWSKTLQLIGVGYRAAMLGNELVLNVGFSHPVRFTKPDNINFTIKKNLITVTGIDKQQVGEMAAKIRKVRPPDPYKGKGIRYQGEIIRRKAGKAAKAVGGV